MQLHDPSPSTLSYQTRNSFRFSSDVESFHVSDKSYKSLFVNTLVVKLESRYV